MKKNVVKFMIVIGFLTGFNVSAAVKESKVFNDFINNMVVNHQFDKASLDKLFSQVEIKQSIIKTMQRPAESMPWYKYRKIFITDTRAQAGLKFWQKYEQVLTEVEAKYGVPADIIVAIIGVETLYGKRTGNHRVIDGLATLAFDYPKRSKFFLSELKHFLILCREEKMNPLEPTGSYAGAMGIPQFMPSSYRAYAADYENDGKRDIWNNYADAIASVANYFIIHRWKKGEDILFPATATGEQYKKALTKGLKPNFKWAELQALNITSDQDIDAAETIKLLSYEQKKGHDLWLGLHNFYVITRYNHSSLYAMAVFQLSQSVKALKDQLDSKIAGDLQKAQDETKVAK